MNFIIKFCIIILFANENIIAQSEPTYQLQSSLKLSYDEAGNRIQRKMLGIIPSLKTDTTIISNLVDTGVLKVFPNPVSKVLNIRSNIELEDYLISLYSITGQVIYEIPFNGIYESIDFENLSSGTYILHLYKDDEEFTWQIIKP